MIRAGDVDMITRLYRIAENKGEQILILAELEATTTDEIIEILKDQGEFNPDDLAGSLRKCSACGRNYIAATKRGRAVCPRCAFLRSKKRSNEKKRAKREQERKKKREGQADGMSISEIVNKIRPAGEKPGKRDLL